jgi:transposase
MRLRGLAYNSSWLFVMEFFGWREFKNRRQVGSLAGLTPTPFASGDMDHELGIDKSGNPRVRTMAIEIAWCWLRFQPQSELSLWFQQRFGNSGKRARRIGIVALARRLLVALWRYVDQGVVPAGAVLAK